jgi:hypothetical protein
MPESDFGTNSHTETSSSCDTEPCVVTDQVFGTDEVDIGSAPPVVASVKRIKIPHEGGFIEEVTEVVPPEAASIADAGKKIAEVRFLLKGWIPFGMLTGIVAQPGEGKSAFALTIAKTITTGAPWFNGLLWRGPPGCVLWCGTENDLAITRSRVSAWGIHPDRLRLPFKDDPLRPIVLTNKGHLAHIEALINQFKLPLVEFDSLRGGHDKDENQSTVW